MNYIKELNSLYRFLEENTLCNSVISLIHTLYLIDNARNWEEWFSVPNNRIMQLSGIGTRQALVTARNKLKQLGRIDFISGEQKKSNPKYKIIPFHGGICQAISNSERGLDIGKADVERRGNVKSYDTLDNTLDIGLDIKLDNRLDIKLDQKDLNINKTKDKEQEENKNACVSAHELTEEANAAKPPALSPLSPDVMRVLDACNQNFAALLQAETIRADVEIYRGEGLDVDVIVAAVHEAAAQGVPRWSYVRGICRDCVTCGVRTLAAFKAHQDEFRKRRASYTQNTARDEPKERGHGKYSGNHRTGNGAAENGANGAYAKLRQHEV